MAWRAGKGKPEVELAPVGERDEDEGQNVEDDPERLGHELEVADQPHAVGDQRDDHDGADDIADPDGDAERQLQRRRHDRGLDGKEHEGEARIDQRGDGRADIAEARAARQKVDIDAVADGIAADRQADPEHDEACGKDGDDGVGGAVGQRDGAADRLQRQEGDRADRRLRDALRGELPGALGGEAQRIVFQRLVGDPAIVFAPDRNDALAGGHAGYVADLGDLIGNVCGGRDF